MADSAVTLWESELLRARQWLAASRRSKQQESDRLFQRVSAHIGYKDHQRSLQSEVIASEDEDDGALDFLGDVDAEDMSVLLQAEAAAVAAPPVEIATPLPGRMPSAGDLLKPLEMPLNLASPKLTPKARSVPMSQLDPTALGASKTISVAASVTLGTDEAVQELMQDLHVHVTQAHLDTEETKTEESTPPHLLKNFGGNSKVRSNGLRVEAGSKTGQSKFMQQVSSKSPQEPHKKKAATPATATTKHDDEVTAEMLSWVSGYRDPEVIQRKENMRRKRKHTNRYGVSSEEEQLQVLQQIKHITRESDSESEDDFSSDYSPAENEEVLEPDEPEVVDLLSDDYLDSDEEKRPMKRKRKRLRQAEPATKKKKARSRKPVVTRKVTQQDFTSKTSSLPANGQEGLPLSSPEDSDSNRTPATTKNASIEGLRDDATGKLNQPIEVMSSGDEAGDSDMAGTLKTRGSRSRSSQRESGGTKESTTVRSKIPETFKSSQNRVFKEATQKKESTQEKSTKAASTTADTEDNTPGIGEISSGLVSSNNKAVGRTQETGILDDLTNIKKTTMQPSEVNGDDDALSDERTVDLEGEDLSAEIEDQDDVTVHEVVVGSSIAAEQKGPEVQAGEEPKMAENTTAEAQPNTEADDDDVSEAETEILEDDEPDTDDLGLDYSDDSDEGSTTRGVKDALGSKKVGTISERILTSATRSDGNSKRKTPSEDKNKSKLDASTAGVQQFFAFTPLKLKPNTKTTSRTSSKPLPVHAYAETHVKKGDNDIRRASEGHKKFPEVTPTKPSVGSNGLRPRKRIISTTTIMKGKYAVTRRSTKMLNPEDAPGSKRHPKSQYTMVSTKMYNKDLDDVPLTILAKEMTKKPDDNPQTRYLSYAGARKTEDTPTYIVETPRIVPKFRFGGGSGLNSNSSAICASPAASNGQNSQIHDKIAPQGGYMREPQISIYDALHMDGQESASDSREGTGYKRPNRFKKMQEEAARNGTPMVKSRLQSTDWDKVPIPKKKKQAPQVEKSKQDALSLGPSKTNGFGTKNGGKTQNKRRKKKLGSAYKNFGPSYYGPQAASLATPDSPSRGHRGREHSNYRHDDDRRKKRSPSPYSRSRERYDRRDDRRRRGSSRSRSRSPSPRGRDCSSRHRRRSRSRSWSWERSSERDNYRSVLSVHDRDLQTGGSLLPEFRSSSKKKDPERPELGEVCQNSKIGGTDRSAKMQKFSDFAEAPPSPGTLATCDDDGDTMYISDSDEDGNAMIKGVEDIRFDLDSVPADEALMARQVYVTGVNPTVFADQIEEDFARFGVAVDRQTGFPAIDIFRCQRNHLGRGDACVTFETEEGAQEAVEELNSKNVKNSMILVRRMDAHTQRILTVQFQMIRNTWKCTGAQCRADVSIWNAKCDKCGRKRVYWPSNIKIVAESWLCSLCFTANDPFATSCHGCMEKLPEVDRSTFYTS